MTTLYATPLSANARKAQAAVAELGLDVDVRLVNVYAGEGRSAEYLRVHPEGKVPALVDGALTLTESNAILVHLAEVHAGGRLFPRDAAERATILSWLFWEAAHWQPALTTVLAGFVGHALLPEHVPAPGAPPHWKHEPLVACLGRLETHLSGRGWLVGESPSIADLSVGGMTTYLAAAGFPFDAFPGFAAWHARLEGLEGWRATATPPWDGGQRA